MQPQYKIIGGDGREYGPASLEELKGWIQDGRASATTQTWRDDFGVWAPAGTYPELADLLEAQPPPLPGQTQAQDKPVGFWARLAAYLADALALAIVCSVVWPLVSYLTGWKVPELRIPDTMGANLDYEVLINIVKNYMKEMQAAMPALIASSVVQWGVRLVYEVSFNGRFGATPGKMILGAQIVRLDGSPLGYKRALLRWLAARVSDILCYAGYLFIAARPDKRALHDLMAGTKVVFKHKR